MEWDSSTLTSSEVIWYNWLPGIWLPGWNGQVVCSLNIHPSPCIRLSPTTTLPQAPSPNPAHSFICRMEEIILLMGLTIGKELCWVPDNMKLLPNCGCSFCSHYCCFTLNCYLPTADKLSEKVLCEALLWRLVTLVFSLPHRHLFTQSLPFKSSPATCSVQAMECFPDSRSPDPPPNPPPPLGNTTFYRYSNN